MISWNEILIRLALAAFFGGMVGVERERKNWTAGLRTHMMVCVGSTLTMMVSAYGFNDVLGNHGIALDPSRVAAQVISGIGFIGAGTILFLRQEVIRGLTTASGLWTVAAIGLATGGGMYFAAIVTTIIAIIILSILKPVEKRFFKHYKYQLIKLQVNDGEEVLQSAQNIFQEKKITIAAISVEKKDNISTVFIRFAGVNENTSISIVNALRLLPFVLEVSWNNSQ